jgi:hypothetical protein
MSGKDTIPVSPQRSEYRIQLSVIPFPRCGLLGARSIAPCGSGHATDSYLFRNHPQCRLLSSGQIGRLWSGRSDDSHAVTDLDRAPSIL